MLGISTKDFRVIVKSQVQVDDGYLITVNLYDDSQGISNKHYVSVKLFVSSTHCYLCSHSKFLDTSAIMQVLKSSHQELHSELQDYFNQ
jgi:hypothetical protein